MKRCRIFLAAFPLLALSACVPYYAGYPEPYVYGPAVVEVPVLPPVVVLETGPYYSYRGFYYYWDSGRNAWLYRSGRGYWSPLPRSHYPERFRYRGKWFEWGRGREMPRGRERGDGRRGRDEGENEE